MKKVKIYGNDGNTVYTDFDLFTNDWVDGDIKHITYNVATDTWSAE